MLAFRILAAAIAGPLLLNAGSAAAQSSDAWYVSVGATDSLLQDPDTVIQNAPAPGSQLAITTGVKNGPGGSAAIGHSYGAFRLEAEIGSTANKTTHYTATSPIVATVPQSGTDRVSRLMANAFYDVSLSNSRLHPYLGVGVGVASVKLSTFAARPVGPPAPTSLIDETQSAFAWQLAAGAALDLNRRIALTAQYRYLDAGKVKGHDTRGQDIETRIAGSNVDLGLRVRF